MASHIALRAFDAECAALVNVLRSLEREDLDRPTNCPPWTLHELVVHITFSIGVPDGLVDAGSQSQAGAPAYYRRPERDTDEYRTANVERTRQLAKSVEPDELAPRFVKAWEQARETFADHDGSKRIAAGGMALTVDSYLLTRIMSVAAHGLDVAITLDREPWTTEEALLELHPLLTDLLGTDPPEHWSRQDLLELGTGRRPLSDADREALGPLAGRFPLLS
jgi:uncharacterized protein (TIGR03083 family)